MWRKDSPATRWDETRAAPHRGAERISFVFDVTQNPPKQVARVDNGADVYWMTITPDGKTIYVSSAEADRWLEMRRRPTSEDRDALAATIILQSFLDSPGKDDVPREVLS